MYKISEQKLSMVQELNDSLKTENNRLKSNYDKIGEESSFVMSKIKELNTKVEEGMNNRKQIEKSLAETTSQNEELLSELESKNKMINEFSDALLNIKNNVENEKIRNNQINNIINELKSENKIKDTQNLRLNEYNQVAKQTILELEKKIEAQNQDIDSITSSYAEIQINLSQMIADIKEKDSKISQLEGMVTMLDDQNKELNNELELVIVLQKDLQKYDKQLQELSESAENREKDLDRMKKDLIDKNLMIENYKNALSDLQTEKQSDLEWKRLYNELRSKVEGFKQSSPSREEQGLTSPLRKEIEGQSERIKLKEQNLDLYTELTESKEVVSNLHKQLKKKDSQIEQLKELLKESDFLRDELLESKLK